MLVKTTNDDFSTGYTVVNMWQNGDDFETLYDLPDGSYFTFAYRTMVPLPVELLSFDALPDAARRLVNLQWQTASEVNNAYFTIERSANNSNWSLLGTVTGAGNSNQPLQYTLQDVFPLSGVSYYRLSQTDLDGTTEIKGVRSVLFGAADSLRIYPNPAEDHLFLEAENVDHLELFDVSGKLCQVRAQQNYDRWTIPVGSLARGVYYLKIYRTTGVSETKKVILH
ncbi:MAG: T9SS type A sorting domain-containing protein [Bacteroidia bacterium]|nr:T9SS type A sorting domain-containing protein [Bacteroidia bacterium]